MLNYTENFRKNSTEALIISARMTEQVKILQRRQRLECISGDLKVAPDSLKSVFNVFLGKPSLGAPEVRHVRNREFVRNNVALSNKLSKVIFPHNPIACLAAFFFVDQLSQKKVNANFFISLIVSLVEPALQRLVTSLLLPFFFLARQNSHTFSYLKKPVNAVPR